MSVDLLSIIVNSKWQTEQVGYHYTRLEPINPATGLGRIWEMKANAAPFPGWPADMNQYDANWIYFFVTEDDNNLHDTPQPPNWNPKNGPWSNRFDPTCYKMQSGVPGKGMIMLPRNLPTLPYDSWHNRLVSLPKRRAGEERRAAGFSVNPDTQYQHVVSCKSQQTKDLGRGRVTLDGPFPWAWGGQLGDCPTYVMNHLYSNLQSKERFMFALRPDGTSYGWVGWDDWALVNGAYVMQGSPSYRNTLVEVAPPIFANPCKF